MNLRTREEIVEHLRLVETVVHEHSTWEMEPTLGLLCQKEVDGEVYSGYAPLPTTFPSANPAKIVAHLGSEFLKHAPASVRRWLVADVPNICGALFVFEAWHIESDNEQEQERILELHASGRALADIPGAVEARMAIAIDLNAEHYLMRRLRGGDLQDLGREIGNIDVLEGLRMMLMAACNELPGHQQAFAKLADTSFVPDSVEFVNLPDQP